MRALLVVLEQPLLGDVLHLFDGSGQVRVEDLGPVGPVEALDVGVLVGPPGSMKRSAMPLADAHSVKSWLVISGPLSSRIESGVPYQSTSRLSERISVLAGIEVPTSMSSAQPWLTC